MIGGGARTTVLCQLTATSRGRPILAGPGRGGRARQILVQLYALGELGSLERDARARRLLDTSSRRYEPDPDAAPWEALYDRFPAPRLPRRAADRPSRS